MLVYFEFCQGCGIRSAHDLKSGEREILREVGTYNGVSTVRKATDEDISWVRGMGGYIPEEN